jgi:uncharacterized protein (TIGR02996 family)
MKGITLVGNARPVKLEAIERHESLPPDYVTLMTTWGPGTLCGIYELPDPTEANGRFAWLNSRLRVEGLGRRRAGAWMRFDEEALVASTVLGVDRSGCALVQPPKPSIPCVLHPRGFAQFIELSSLVDNCVKDETQYWADCANDDKHNMYRKGRGIPRIFVTDAPSPRPELLDALGRGDQEAADAALQRLLAREVAASAAIELACWLAGPTGQHVPTELRASFTDELLRLAKRKIPRMGDALPIREIRAALAATGEVGKPLLDKLLDSPLAPPPPEGIFAGAPDATESALLDELARSPDDEGARLVYADHLEDQGDTARAAAVRAATVAPLANAVERGLAARRNAKPIDEAANLRELSAHWHEEDPRAPIDELIARFAALHPTQRLGYIVLLSELTSWDENSAKKHLAREAPEAWPYLLLAARTKKRRTILELVAPHRIPEAAPFLLSLIRHPPREHEYDELLPDVLEQAAAIYLELVKVSDEAVAELLALLEHDVRATRLSAFALLQKRADDDRVFLAYLDNFAFAHPFSEKALGKRKKDPRIIPALLAQFDVEEKRSLTDGKHLRYTFGYGVLARFLGKLGNQRGKEAAKRFKATSRWGQERPDNEMY